MSCKHDDEKDGFHPCPYQEDINDNHDPEFCDCCIDCIDECAADI